MKRQATAWEKTFENHISDKELVPIKDSQNSTVTKIHNPIRKWTKVANKHFIEKYIDGK